MSGTNPFKKLRESLPDDVTQKQIADRAGKTIACIWNYENDKSAPSLAEADKWAEVYSVTRERIEKAIVELNRRLSAKQPATAGK